MSAMISEVYDALKEAGASDEKARAAAEAIAQYNERFQALDTRLIQIEGQLGRIEERLAAASFTLGGSWV